MAYKKSKSKEEKIYLQKYIPLLVFFGFIINLFVIVRFEKSKLPQVVYYVSTNSVHNVESDSKTNDIILPSSNDSKNLDDNSTENEIVEKHYYYHYFIDQGRRAITLFGRYYSEGSPMSLGRIVRIYPDRIYLDNNIIIINTRWENYSPIENKNNGEIKNE